MSNPYKDFDEYGLRHMPEHLIDLEQWDTLEAFLTDLYFIEAKCAAGMTYELIADYAAALDALPDLDAQEERRIKWERETRVQKYIEDLIAYARHEIDTLEIIPTVEPWSKECITGHIERIKTNPTCFDRIYAFMQFVNAESHALMKFATHSGFVIQHAYNSADSGPVVWAAEAFIKEVHDVLLLHVPSSRLSYNPLPVLMKTLEGHIEPINCVSITPDSRRVVSGSNKFRPGNPWVSDENDYTIRVWNLENGSCLHVLKGHTHDVQSVCITPDGRYAVSGSYDKTLRMWDLEKGYCLHVLEDSKISCVSITPDGRRAVSGGFEHSGTIRAENFERSDTIRVWNLENGSCLHVLKGHTHDVQSVCITPDGRRAVSGSRDKTLRVWDLEKGHCLHILEVSSYIKGYYSHINCMSITPDGRRMVSGSGGDEYTIRFWNLENGSCLHVLKGHTHDVQSVCITPDGRRAVSGSRDKTLRVWDLENGHCLHVLKAHGDVVNGVSITSDGRYAVSGSDDRTLRVWDLEHSISLPTFVGESFDNVTVFPDGQRAVSVTHSTPPEKWDTMSGDGSSTLRVWNMENGHCLHVLDGHTHEVNSISITPDNQRTVSGSYDTTLRVWDIESGHCLHILKEHTDVVNSVSISPDGRYAVSGSRDQTLRVWDIENGTCLRTFAGISARISEEYSIDQYVTDGPPKAQVWQVSITPDGRHALSISEYFGFCHLEQITEVFSGRWEDYDNQKYMYAYSLYEVNVWSLTDNHFLQQLNKDLIKGILSDSIIPGSHSSNIRKQAQRAYSTEWDSKHSGRDNMPKTPNGGYLAPSSETIRVWDLSQNNCFGVYHAKGEIVSLSAISSKQYFMVSTHLGETLFLHIHNLPIIPIEKPPVVTTCRLWLYGVDSHPGQWDEHLTVICHWCGQRFSVAKTILDVINAITRNANLPPDQSPFMNLPREAWNEPKLLSECPYCHQPLKFNPFLVDNRDGFIASSLLKDETVKEKQVIVDPNSQTSTVPVCQDEIKRTEQVMTEQKPDEIKRNEQVIIEPTPVKKSWWQFWK